MVEIFVSWGKGGTKVKVVVMSGGDKDGQGWGRHPGSFS